MSGVISMRVVLYTHRDLTYRERELVDRECQRVAARLIRQWDSEDAARTPAPTTSNGEGQS